MAYGSVLLVWREATSPGETTPRWGYARAPLPCFVKDDLARKVALHYLIR
jgi:hypothetical protein